MREFKSPGGRRWTAILFYVPGEAMGVLDEHCELASTSVLRFRSEDLTLDLADWPDNWISLSDDALVGLLRKATLPRFYGLQPRYELESSRSNAGDC